MAGDFAANYTDPAYLVNFAENYTDSCLRSSLRLELRKAGTDLRFVSS